MTAWKLNAQLRFSIMHRDPVTFRKGVTPWLPFRRLESMVAPDWIPGLLVAC